MRNKLRRKVLEVLDHRSVDVLDLLDNLETVIDVELESAWAAGFITAWRGVYDDPESKPGDYKNPHKRKRTESTR